MLDRKDLECAQKLKPRHHFRVWVKNAELSSHNKGLSVGLCRSNEKGGQQSEGLGYDGVIVKEVENPRKNDQKAERTHQHQQV
jgi:hypothetical protein